MSDGLFGLGGMPHSTVVKGKPPPPTPQTPPQVLTNLPFGINAGGPQLTVGGVTYLADTDPSLYSDGGIVAAGPGTGLVHDERYQNDQGNGTKVTYSSVAHPIRVTGSTRVKVTLMVAEVFFATNVREFNVLIGGNYYQAAYNIFPFSLAGNQANVPVSIPIVVNTVSDGAGGQKVPPITFESVGNNAEIVGILIEDGTNLAVTATYTPPAGGFHTMAKVLYDFTDPVLRTDAWAGFGQNELFPAGTPVGYDWYAGARDFVMPTPAGSGGFPWWQVFDTTIGSPTYNCRVQIRRYLFAKYTSSWVVMFTGDATANNGGYWNGGFGGAPGQGFLAGTAAYGGPRAEANGGGFSLPLSPLGNLANCDALHTWGNYGDFVHTDALMTYYRVEARLIPDTDPNVNLSSARFMIAGGTDVYSPGHSTFYGGPLQTRLKLLGYQGQNAFDGWSVLTVSGITAAGMSSLGLASNVDNATRANAMKTFLNAHNPPLALYP